MRDQMFLHFAGEPDLSGDAFVLDGLGVEPGVDDGDGGLGSDNLGGGDVLV